MDEALGVVEKKMETAAELTFSGGERGRTGHSKITDIPKGIRFQGKNSVREQCENAPLAEAVKNDREAAVSNGSDQSLPRPCGITGSAGPSYSNGRFDGFGLIVFNI